MGRMCGWTVRFSDRKGFQHSTEVQAASVYEAAYLAWAKLRSDAEAEEESFRASEFIVEVQQDPRVFHVGQGRVRVSSVRSRTAPHLLAKKNCEASGRPIFLAMLKMSLRSSAAVLPNRRRSLFRYRASLPLISVQGRILGLTCCTAFS